jgi:hypothetical protein
VDVPPVAPGLTLERSRKYGDTTLSFFVRESE